MVSPHGGDLFAQHLGTPMQHRLSNEKFKLHACIDNLNKWGNIDSITSIFLRYNSILPKANNKKKSIFEEL